MTLKHLSLSALAGFVFAGSRIASADAAPLNACTACWRASLRPLHPDHRGDCETRLLACRRRNNRPLPGAPARPAEVGKQA